MKIRLSPAQGFYLRGLILKNNIFQTIFETKLKIKMDVAKVHVRFRREAFKASVLARWVWFSNMAPESKSLPDAAARKGARKGSRKGARKRLNLGARKEARKGARKEARKGS